MGAEDQGSDAERIRDVLHRYCRAIDRRDIVLLRSCYHPDSIDQRASFTGNGHDFCDYAMDTVASAAFTQHRLSNILIELDGPRAFAESYVSAIHRFAQGDVLLDFLHYGRYCDVLERRDGAWRIAYRLHLTDGNSVSEVQGLGEGGQRDVAAAGNALRGVAGPQDPSYRTFDISELYRPVPTVTGMFEQRVARWLERRGRPNPSPSRNTAALIAEEGSCRDR